MANKTGRFSLTLSPDLYARLDSFSERSGMTKNGIIAQALYDYFQKNDMMENGVQAVIEMFKQNPDILRALNESDITNDKKGRKK